MPYVQAPAWEKARASYNYCTICGHTPKKDEPANRAPLKFWDPDDGWKIGTLCPWCADDALTTEPKPTDYAYKSEENAGLMQLLDNVHTDEDPLLAL
jgi:hypothetical protein